MLTTLLAPPSLLLRGAARRSVRPVLSAAKLGSLLDVCESYDCLLLDQFGVIHDGTTAYDGAVSAVSELQRRGKKIVIISNSSRRRGDTVARLRQMGFAISDDDVVTSGDLVFEGLRAGVDAPRPPFDGLGMRCFVFGNGADDEQYVRDAGRVAAPVESADFILARGLFSMLGAGPDLLRQPSADYTAEAEAKVLAAAMARTPGGLPLLVANPDLTRPDGNDSVRDASPNGTGVGAADIRSSASRIRSSTRRAVRLAASGIEGGRIAAVGDLRTTTSSARATTASTLCSSAAASTAPSSASRRRRRRRPSRRSWTRCWMGLRLSTAACDPRTRSLASANDV